VWVRGGGGGDGGGRRRGRRGRRGGRGRTAKLASDAFEKVAEGRAGARRRRGPLTLTVITIICPGHGWRCLS
jgi:hypothetical protein